MRRGMHGYDLYHQYQSQLGRVWRMSQSQMYAILKRLEAQGLVSGLVEEDSRGPSRRHFAVTEMGQERFSRWLLEPSDCSSRVMRLEFISRLFFASMKGKKTLELVITEQIAASYRELGNHERIYEGLDASEVFNRLALDLRVRQLKAMLEWLNALVAQLPHAE